ncbi:type IV fimbrial biogenesis protein FimT [Variovorax sp. CF079]|uniref:GspH/FimT family pseudopilin n=1 Tax=Variovorax sp. CF079 TaxID=1882774 RepID=UPI000880CF1A|nr:GspH/FimT family pseudopilin [Variovorax sp. CF079]SDD74078.1 type IV fimbrial biogenesis protein FimT [Variovorax sp. CF079]
MHALPVYNRRAAGFTLIELMVTVSIMALLAMLAVPAFSTWIANSKVRTIANALQDGLRTAQTEATRRSRQVVFALTDDSNPSDGYTAKENGKYWAINTITLTDSGETAAFVEAGVLAASGANVTITGPVAVCFNSLGRLVTNASPGVTSASCTAGDSTYKVELAGADRPLHVQIKLGGQVRMCDPAKTLSATQPDGCTAS